MPETLHERIRAFILGRRLLQAGDRVGVAVSGGADSVALLRLLLDLRDAQGLVLSIVHFNHRIRGAAADADHDFVRDLAQRFELEFHAGHGDVPAYAQSKHLSHETAARELRYNYFHQLLRSGALDRLATAHTLDDQAETVLMRFVRGAWTQGLAGIYPKVPADTQGSKRIAEDQDKTIVRPLLEVRRVELCKYLHMLGQEWREDASNQDVKHLRNRVRHVLLPLLESKFNPGIRDVLAGLAEIARGEEGYWHGELEHAQTAKRTTYGGFQLFADEMQNFPVAMQRRLVRDAAAQLGLSLDFRAVEALLGLLQALEPTRLDISGEWSADINVQRHANGDAPARRVIEFRPVQAQRAVSPDYEYLLPVPGEVYIPETGQTITAALVSGEEGADPQNLLRHPENGSEPLRVRNWRPGDRFWPAHSRSPKKVKELLQSRHVSGDTRALWTVIANGQAELVWMQGFGAAKGWLCAPGDVEAIQLACRQ